MSPGFSTESFVVSIIISSVIAPGRSILGNSPVQSIIVDSTPTSDSPPSRIKSTDVKYFTNSEITASAEVGETCPKRFALGAAIPFPLTFGIHEEELKQLGDSGLEAQRFLVPSNKILS